MLYDSADFIAAVQKALGPLNDTILFPRVDIALPDSENSMSYREVTRV